MRGLKLLDLSIIQEEGMFDFPSMPIIIEEIPHGMELTGWQEGKDTVKKYAHQIAQEQNMKYYEWIYYHKLQVNKMILKYMQKVT